MTLIYDQFLATKRPVETITRGLMWEKSVKTPPGLQSAHPVGYGREEPRHRRQFQNGEYV
jgi:hypothetical protein